VAESDWTPALKSYRPRRFRPDNEIESLQDSSSASAPPEAAIEEIDEIVDWLRETADESLLR